MVKELSLTAIPEHSGIRLSDAGTAPVALPQDAAAFEQLLMATLGADATGNGKPIDPEALLALLIRFQLKGEYPHPYQDSLLALLRSEAGAEPAVRECNIIRFLDGVFRTLLRECALDATLLALLHRLHIPVTCLALQDSAFLDRADHPGRLLVDDICHYGIGWHQGLGKAGQRFLDTVCDALSQLDHGLDAVPACIAAIQQALHTALEREGGQFDKLVERTIATESGLLKIRRAEQEAIELLNRLMAGKRLPVDLTRMVQRQWFLILKQVLMQHGPDSEPWARLRKLTTHLVWTLLPSSEAAEKQKKYAIIARLPELIQQELGGHELPGVDLEGIIANLDATYVAMLKGEAMDEATVVPLNTTALETGIDVDISHTLIEHARTIDCGQWFLLTPEDGEPLRIRLVQKDDASNHYLFVNRAGLKALDASIEQVAFHLVNGRLKALKQQAAFTQAYLKLTQQLLREHEEKLRLTALEREAARQRAEIEARQRAEAIEKARQEAEAVALAEAEARERATLEARRAEERRQAETLARERNELDAREKACRLAIEAMALGTWVQLFNDDGTVTECNLALKMRSTNKYVFVNRAGIKVAERKGEELLALMLDGKFAIVDSSSVSDSAIQRLIGSLKQP